MVCRSFRADNLPDAALDLPHEASGGIQRIVNILCHKSLMVAFCKGDHLITYSHVEK
jgi:MSHA biogenesis protein MshM